MIPVTNISMTVGIGGDSSNFIRFLRACNNDINVRGLPMIRQTKMAKLRRAH